MPRFKVRCVEVGPFIILACGWVMMIITLLRDYSLNITPQIILIVGTALALILLQISAKLK